MRVGLEKRIEPLDERKSTTEAGLLVNGQHGLPKRVQRDPMRRIFEAGRVENEDEVATRVIPADGRKMTVARLRQKTARVRADDESVLPL